MAIKPPKIKKLSLNLGQGVKSQRPKINEIQLACGTKVFLRNCKETPIISVKAAFLGGLRAEPENCEGLTELASRVWPAGTPEHSEVEINHQIEAMAARFHAFSGRNTMGLSMTLLSPFEEEGCDLFSNILVNPSLPEPIIEREKLIMRESIRTQQDQPARLAVQTFLKKMFNSHPYSRDLAGTLKSIENLNYERVKAHLCGMSMSSNLMLSISGDFTARKWISRLEESLSSFQKGKTFCETFNLPELLEDDFSFQELKKEQTHIVMGFRGVTISDPKRYALHVLQSILSGQGGRLFIELRDKNSLAYTVSPMRLDGVDTGYFGAYIGCSPDKGKKAVAMLNEEFDKLLQKAPPEEEVERAKKYLIGRHDIDLQRNSAYAGSILFNEIYGINYKEMFDFPSLIQKVTAQDVQNLAKELFTQKKIMVAVGATNPF